MGVVNARKNFSFLCDYASISIDGKLSMNGIFEHINSRKFPLQFPLMYLVVNISGASNGDIFTCELISRNEPNRKLIELKADVKIGPDKNFGFIGQLVNITFNNAGEYILKFFIDNREIGNHPILVKHL